MIILPLVFSIISLINQNSDQRLPEGIWYYIQDGSYNEMITTDSLLYLIKSDESIHFYEYRLRGAELQLADSEDLVEKQLITSDSTRIEIREAGEIVVFHHIQPIHEFDKEMLYEDPNEFWRRYKLDFSMRQWKYQETD